MTSLCPARRIARTGLAALVLVGILMFGSVRRIAFDDPTELVPAFLTLATMGFTYNIANGLTAGLVAVPVCKILAGRGRELTPGGAVLGAACLAYYLFGLPHEQTAENRLRTGPGQAPSNCRRSCVSTSAWCARSATKSRRSASMTSTGEACQFPIQPR